MSNPSFAELRKSRTDASFQLYLYKLTIKELHDELEAFESYGMYEDCAMILKVLNEKINQIVTRIEL